MSTICSLNYLCNQSTSPPQEQMQSGFWLDFLLTDFYPFLLKVEISQVEVEEGEVFEPHLRLRLHCLRVGLVFL